MNSIKDQENLKKKKILLRLDSEAIKTSQEKLKREYDKAKRKSK